MDNIKKLALKKPLSRNELKDMLFNYSHWQNSAKRFAASHEVSWADKNMVAKEIANVREYLKNGDNVLDAGCSNGYSTFEIAKNKDIKVRAFDYSARAINIAKNEQAAKDPKKKIYFYHSNVLNIDELDNKFDVAYTIRVIINLPAWKAQKEAILEMHRVLKPKGIYLFSEAFAGGLKNINSLRRLAGLKPLAAHKFNLYISEKRLEDFVRPYFDIIEIRKFSSIYYAASRFLRYLTMDKTDKDSFDNEINNFFAGFKETSNSGDFGIQKLYVLKKRGLK